MSRLVYLDGSILSRMADDVALGQDDRARAQNRSIMAAAGVLSLIENRGLRAVTSWHAMHEIAQSDSIKRGRILKYVPTALQLLPKSLASENLAAKLTGRPFSETDALHAAYAHHAGAVLLTTDGCFVRAALQRGIVQVKVVCLFDWIRDDYISEARPKAGRFPRCEDKAKRQRAGAR